jgi:hypothetical protein
MKPKRLPLWLAAMGIVLLIPLVLWIAGSESRLNQSDERIAFEPLIRIHLDKIDEKPISAAIMIPNTAQWRKIRRVWGEPEFVISAINSVSRDTVALPGWMRTELVDSTGRIIPLRTGNPSYGHSGSTTDCLRFHAVPGSELTLRLAGTKAGTAPVGDLTLVVEGDWFNTKDKLVGLSLNEDLQSLVTWLSVLGLLLLVAATGIFFFANPRPRRQQ